MSQTEVTLVLLIHFCVFITLWRQMLYQFFSIIRTVLNLCSLSEEIFTFYQCFAFNMLMGKYVWIRSKLKPGMR